jgi:hypothetical protein
MMRLIETDIVRLRNDLDAMLKNCSTEESIERVALRGRWRRAVRPMDGEIFSSFGADRPACIAARLPGPAPQLAIVAICDGDDGGATVEIVGAVRDPEMPLAIFRIAEIWRRARNVKTAQRSRKYWSGWENPLPEA